MTKSIFLAAPISGFHDDKLYNTCRTGLMDLITVLQREYNVYSELISIDSLDSYDDPGIAIKRDLEMIDNSDFFIIYHPCYMQTSTFIELGYAIAKRKRIIVIGKKDSLPYLSLGLLSYDCRTTIIDSSELNESTNELVIKSLKDIEFI